MENPSLLGREQRQIAELKTELPDQDKAADEAKIRHGYNSHGWSGKSIRDMARDVGMLNDYDSGYALLSELEHSTVGAVYGYMTVTADGQIDVHGTPSQNWVPESLGIALLLLIAISKLVDRILELGLSTELQAFDTKALRLRGAKRLSK